MVEIVIFSVVAFSLGAIFGLYLFKIILDLADTKIFNQNSDYFRIVLDHMKKNGKFMSRVNNYVEISIEIPNDRISLIFLIDKNDVAIFRNSECIKSSHNCDRSIIDDIISEIIFRWGNRINVVVNMNGSVLDKNTYKRIIGNLSYQGVGDILPKKLKPILKLDDILDKINDIGIDGLSDDEKEYLKNIK
jgi:hypothetical protein